jgi:hypothetical protein
MESDYLWLEGNSEIIIFAHVEMRSEEVQRSTHSLESTEQKHNSVYKAIITVPHCHNSSVQKV